MIGINNELKAQIIRKFTTITAFARAIGVREDRVSKIIHGRTIPTANERALICNKLGVPEREIFSEC
jgi:transcriptional regulator with XRE-family HTH domain